MAKKRENYKTIPVRYVKDWQVGRGEDGESIVLPVYDTQQITRSHTRRYHNSLWVLAGLTGCARDLMDYLTEEMDEDNIVCTDKYLREAFKVFIWNNTYTATTEGIDYGTEAIKKALAELTRRNLLIRQRRGYSRVNPLYFWRNDDTRRTWVIKQWLEEQAGVPEKLAAIKKQVSQE